MTSPFLPTLALLISALVIASDMYARRVPNAWLLAALLFASAVKITTWLQGAGDPPWPSLFGLIIGAAALLPFHVLGWMGAGDVKFFATLGFLLGPKALLPIWIISSLIAGMNAAAILLSRNWLMHAVPGWAQAQARFSTSPFGQRLAAARAGREGLPYAAWLGVGALITTFNPALMHW